MSDKKDTKKAVQSGVFWGVIDLIVLFTFIAYLIGKVT